MKCIYPWLKIVELPSETTEWTTREMHTHSFTHARTHTLLHRHTNKTIRFWFCFCVFHSLPTTQKSVENVPNMVCINCILRQRAFNFHICQKIFLENDCCIWSPYTQKWYPRSRDHFIGYKIGNANNVKYLFNVLAVIFLFYCLSV